MAIVAAGIVTGYDWQADKRFAVRLDIYSHTTERSASGVLTNPNFSIEDSEAAVNAGIYTFLQAYILNEWEIVFDPATDTIEIVNPYRKAGASTALSSVNLLAFWKLDEDTGTPRADSVGSNHFTEVGTVPQTGGKLGAAAGFGGDGGHLVIAGSPNFVFGDFDLTFSFWVKPLGGGTAPIFSSWDSVLDSEVYGLWWNSDETIEFHAHDGVDLNVYPTSFVAAVNVWSFCQVCYRAADDMWSVRMDGVETDVALTIPLNTSDRFAIGGCDAGAGTYFYGAVDAFGYWRRVLSAAEAALLYNNGAGQEWPFSEVVPPAVPFGTGFTHIVAGGQETNAQPKVTFDEIQDCDEFSVLANITADPVAAVPVSISQVLDLLTGAANGDIIYRTGGVWVRLPKGTAGQVLTMNAGATAPEWQTP